MSKQLKVLAQPCGSGTCPTLYQDEEGRLFIQGTKLVPEARTDIAIASHEEVVEISPDLLPFLHAQPE